MHCYIFTNNSASMSREWARRGSGWDGRESRLEAFEDGVEVHNFKVLN